MMSPLYGLKETIKALLKFVKDDFNSFQNEEDTWLYQFVYLDEVVRADIDQYYKEAKEIFLRSEGDRNMITVELEFPKDTTILPVIVLREPSRIDGDTNIIGGAVKDVVTLENNIQMQVFRDSKQFSYDIMCVSLNYKESLIISDVLYGLCVGAYDTFARDYEKVGFSLRELMVNPEFNPYPVFIRSIGLALQKSNFIPSIVRKMFIDSVKFSQGIIIADYGKESDKE